MEHNNQELEREKESEKWEILVKRRRKEKNTRFDILNSY